MSSLAIKTMPAVLLFCPNCRAPLESEAKFCGECGAVCRVPQNVAANFAVPENALEGKYLAGTLQTAAVPMETVEQAPPDASPAFMPAFIRPAQMDVREVESIQAELAKLYVLLARERLFLYMHWLIFLGTNLLGFWMSLKCYTDFIGDEMSKLMIASTPFLFINSVALCCLVPIKGTRAEIVHLKERIEHLRFKLEFGHLL